MNEKEIAELRRRYKPDKSNISHIRGCYVNETGEIVSEFNQSLALTAQEETEKLLAILKKSLSGTLGKNLIDISFETKQVVDGEEHALLMALRDSKLGDDEAVQALYRRILNSVMIEGSYMILLAHDTYDVPFRSRDGERMEDASTDVFSYILCAICPVKLTKPALSYYVYENEFHSLQTDWNVSSRRTRTGEEERVSTPVSTPSGSANPRSFRSIRGRAPRRVSATAWGRHRSSSVQVTPGQ